MNDEALKILATASLPDLYRLQLCNFFCNLVEEPNVTSVGVENLAKANWQALTSLFFCS